MVVLPSDHLIRDIPAFQVALASAVEAADCIWSLPPSFTNRWAAPGPWLAQTALRRGTFHIHRPWSTGKITEPVHGSGQFGWSDVGSWDAVYEISEKDENRNSTQGNVVAVDCRDSLIRSHDRLVAVIDMDGVSIIETTDAVLVMRRGGSEKVRSVVEVLSKGSGTEHFLHVTVNRPWGSYTVLEEGHGFKIKRIEVSPGGRLTLQRHEHRSEHWVVTAGEATVTSGDSVSRLKANESAFIPIGTIHRLENLGTTPLQIIEVQVGSYVGEDDIQRFDDQYGRFDEVARTK